MSHLFTNHTFVDFGPCTLQIGAEAPVLKRIHGSRPAALRAALREQCPRQPGVYGMIDVHGELVYIGKAKNLRARLLTYFRPRSRDPKAGRIVAQSRSILWEPCPDEFAALHRELELIRRWRPRCNVQGKPHSGQHTHVCLGRSPAPYAFLARRPPARVLASFGPIPAGARARAAMRRLNDWFGLRDCPQAQEMCFAEQVELFPAERNAGCLRYELGTCLGPCAGACAQVDYARHVRKAWAFLGGRDLTPLVHLQRGMQVAAAQQAFERAAALRDKLVALEWLNRQLERVRQAAAMGTVLYPVQGHDERVRWYVLHAGRAVAAVPCRERESLLPGTAHAKELEVLAHERSRAGRPAEQLAGALLLAGWFRRYPAEREKTILVSLARRSESQQARKVFLPVLG